MLHNAYVLQISKDITLYYNNMFTGLLQTKLYLPRKLSIVCIYEYKEMFDYFLTSRCKKLANKSC